MQEWGQLEGVPPWMFHPVRTAALTPIEVSVPQLGLGLFAGMALDLL